MTNADKIRSMTDEELHEFLYSISRNCWDGTCLTNCPLHECCGYEAHWIEDWLKQEVTDNA